jgi:predicted alpha/beta hydrolase
MDAYLEQSLTSPEERATAMRTLEIPAADGFPLAATLFEPRAAQGRTARVAVVSSAMGVPRAYYARFARFLAASGWRVVTYDYRGIGDSRSGPLPRLRARLRDWGEKDLAGVIAWVGRELGDAEPAVIGHSVGGQLVGLAENNARISRLLLVGAQSGHWRLWPGAARARALAFWYGIVPPVTRVLGYLPGAVLGGESVPGGVAREWARWARRPGYMVGGADGERAAGYARVTAPILAYSFTDDTFAPAAAVRALLDLYRGATKTHRHLVPRDVGRRAIGHFGFFRAAQRERLWSEARAWLESPAAAYVPAVNAAS